MFPLKDDNPTTILPVVTWALIAVNVMVFLYQFSLGPSLGQLFAYKYGMIPAVVVGERALPQRVGAVAPAGSLFTSMFLHGGWLHLIGNMWFLYIFGNNIEEAMGHLRYLVFYLLCGLCASVCHIIFNADSVIPSIGASGAISGVLGAYAVIYPHARVWTLIFFIFFIRILYIPAAFFLGIWFVMQLLSGGAAIGQQGGGIAFWAHVGGFVAGVLLVGFFKKRSVRFFNPSRRHPSFYDY
jgi:membrane associated rhomboid family serine protease